MPPTRTTLKYLERYAQPETAIAESIDERFDHVVVVPVLAESSRFLSEFLPRASGALVILVVNGNDDRHDSEHRTNADMLRTLDGRGRPVWRTERHGIQLLVIDRASIGRRLPPGEGVGLARRVGCDVALAMQSKGTITSRWIHTTDADACLPNDYFDFHECDGSVALTYPFVHDCDMGTTLGRATAHYEVRLRYYVAMLQRARSPYAVHTIGSTIAIDGDAYAQVRGIPRRAAGEDFYVINKLVKIGGIGVPNTAPIRIAARHSARAPFGTGPAVSKLAMQLKAEEPPALYHPDCFILLRQWLHWLDVAAARGEADFDGLDPRLRHVIMELGTKPRISHLLSESRTPEGRRRKLHDWFDGLKTLRLIHGLRDHGLSSVDWKVAISSLGAPVGDIGNALQWLRNTVGEIGEFGEPTPRTRRDKPL